MPVTCAPPDVHALHLYRNAHSPSLSFSEISLHISLSWHHPEDLFLFQKCTSSQNKGMPGRICTRRFPEKKFDGSWYDFPSRRSWKGDVMPSPQHLAGEEMNKSSPLIHFCVTSFSVIDWSGVKLTKRGWGWEGKTFKMWLNLLLKLLGCFLFLRSLRRLL